jgi:DNA-binding CsgD family transcriptional regulator
MIPALDDILAGPEIQSDEIIQSLLLEADQWQDAALYICRVTDRKVVYMSPACEMLIGYSQENFVVGGPDFFYSITDPVAIPEIVLRQVAYTKEAKTSGFDPSSMIIHEFPTRIITANQGNKDLLCLSVVLTYTETADLDFGVAVILEYKSHTMQKCRSLLEAVKRRHNSIHRHRDFQRNGGQLHLVHITGERIDKKISQREEQVLALLANGASTKDIAHKLSITEHTVETHRKHLLEKLDAKNTAELIKKASKVFWLE